METVIIPTDRCNLRCKHCLRTNYSEMDLEINTLQKFLDSYCQHNFEKLFCLTGGEPTTHPKFADILSLLKQYGFKGRIISNGQNLDSIREIIKYSSIISSVRISLEGPPKINDEIRGKGSFEKAIKAIGLLKKNKIRTRVRMTVSLKNAPYLKEMLKIGEKYGFDELGFAAILPCENAQRNKLEELADFEKYYATFEKIKKKYQINSYFVLHHILPYDDPDWPSNLCCYVNDKTGKLILRPNGDMVFCSFLYDYDFDYARHDKNTNEKKLDWVLGNINRNSLAEILQKRKYLIKELTERRRRDAASNKLSGARRLFCENCRFYFYGQ